LVLFFKKERLAFLSLPLVGFVMQQLRFDGQAVIITGGARGLGLAYARLLASRGALLVMNDLGVALDGSGGSEAPALQAA